MNDKVQRYRLTLAGGIRVRLPSVAKDLNGKYVEYDDYARLASRVKKLEAALKDISSRPFLHNYDQNKVEEIIKELKLDDNP